MPESLSAFSEFLRLNSATNLEAVAAYQLNHGDIVLDPFNRRFMTVVLVEGNKHEFRDVAAEYEPAHPM